jgi:hypothetical protein
VGEKLVRPEGTDGEVADVGSLLGSQWLFAAEKLVQGGQVTPLLLSACTTSSSRFASRGWMLDWTPRLAVRLSSFGCALLSSGRLFGSSASIPGVAEILAHPTIIEMDYLPQDHACLLTLFLLTALREQIRIDPNRRRAGLHHVTVIEDFQLQIEHAMDLDGADLALFLDASVAAAHPFTFTETGPREGLTHTSHAMAPEAVLDVFARVLGRRPPPAFVLAIRGDAFELGTELGEAAAERLEAAWDFVRPLIEAPDAAAWRAMVTAGRTGD